MGSSYPEGNFEGNQLVDSSISLSLVYPSQTNDLHIKSLWATTRVLSGFALLRHSQPSFGSQQVCSHLNLSLKIKVGRRCNPLGDLANQLPCTLQVRWLVDLHTCQTPWFVFQDRPNGEPTSQCQEHTNAEAHYELHAACHDCGNDSTAGIIIAWA